MYHQVLEIGDGAVPAVIDYDIDPDCNVLWIASIKVSGIEMLGAFIQPQIEDIEHQLTKRHDSVVREMDWLHGESVAADRAEFRETYGA